MPIIRKVLDLRTCKAITLPISWIRFFEQKLGREIHYVAIEVNKELTVVPYFPETNSQEEQEVSE